MALPVAGAQSAQTARQSCGLAAMRSQCTVPGQCIAPTLLRGVMGYSNLLQACSAALLVPTLA
jgi:hypothetical protein